MIGDAIRRWLENSIRNWLTTIFEEDAVATLPALDILTTGRLELHGLKLRAGLLPVGLPVQLQEAHVSKLTFTVSLLKLRVRVSIDGVMVQMRLHVVHLQHITGLCSSMPGVQHNDHHHPACALHGAQNCETLQQPSDWT